MKKFKPLIFVFACIIIICSCNKKQEVEMHGNHTPAAYSEEQQKIIRFLDVLKQHENGVKTEGEPVSQEEALWYWDAAFNYQYGFPNYNLEQYLQDTIYETFPDVNINGSISENDLFQTYSKIIEQSRNHYISVNFENKVLKYITIKKIENNKSNDNSILEIILVIGNINQSSLSQQEIYELFAGEGDGVPWGTGGTKNINDTTNYANDILTNAIAAYDFPFSAAPQGQYLWVYDIREVTYEPKNDPQNWWLFYATAASDTANIAISSSDLNTYYTTIMTKTHNNGELSLHPTTLQPYYSAAVVAKTRPLSNGVALYHSLKVQYANQVWVNRNPEEL